MNTIILTSLSLISILLVIRLLIGVKKDLKAIKVRSNKIESITQPVLSYSFKKTTTQKKVESSKYQVDRKPLVKTNSHFFETIKEYHLSENNIYGIR